mgnify:CR=1 FL=1
MRRELVMRKIGGRRGSRRRRKERKRSERGLTRRKMRQVEKYGGYKEIDDSLDKRWSRFGPLDDYQRL